MFRRSHAFVLGLLGLLLVGCNEGQGVDEVTGLEYGGGEFEQRLNSSGFPRLYLVYVPSTITPQDRAPLLLVYHGLNQTVPEIRDLTGFNALAEERGWVVAYLFASVGQWAVDPGAFPATQGWNDLDFSSQVVTAIESDIQIDRDRVFAAGYSDGGLMAHRLACNLAGEIAAIASVGATLLETTADSCIFTRPVPAVFFQGDEDPLFPWEGVEAEGEGALSASETASWWAQEDGCTDDRAVTSLPDLVDDGTTVDLWEYDDCSASASVDFYAILGGGHTWPGSTVRQSTDLGPKSLEIDASQAILDFFSQHPMP